jgi:hypothetical protein
MTPNQFRRLAVALDGATEGAHMNHPDFRAHGRILASLHQDLKFGMVVLTRAQQARFMAESDAFAPESGAWGRSGCTRVTLAAVDEEALGEALTLAWQNVAAKAKKPARRRVSG